MFIVIYAVSRHCCHDAALSFLLLISDAAMPRCRRHFDAITLMPPYFAFLLRRYITR